MTNDNQPERSVFSKIMWGFLGILGLVYLLNPGAGLLEVIPDNIPFVGNLDEATAVYLVLAALKTIFGIDITPKVKPKKK